MAVSSTKAAFRVSIALSGLIFAFWVLRGGMYEPSAAPAFVPVNCAGDKCLPDPAPAGTLAGASGGSLDGCGSSSSSPFQAPAKLDCGNAPLEHVPTGEGQLLDDGLLAARLLALKPNLQEGDLESAHLILSYSGSCPSTALFGIAGVGHVCEVSKELEARALEVLNAGAERGSPDAQFFLANWMFSNLMRPGSFQPGISGGDASAERLHAERLLSQAISGGSLLAIKFVELRDRP